MLRRHFYGYPCRAGLVYVQHAALPARLHDEFDAWAEQGYASPFDDLIVATANRNSAL